MPAPPMLALPSALVVLALSGAVKLVPAAAAPAIPTGGSTTPTLGAALEPSNAEQVALAQHLRRVGARFYGAWWCPACFKQKNLFGQQAGNQLPYVECEKTESQRERCSRDQIGAYPTWVLGSRRLEGVQSLEELGQWSGFRR
ncbi:MAG: hypothetical protein VKO44_08530 [Cyanobacteriota bacterium]|nr:hypothetical protein [Cyanobacteriota bacterium]